MNSDGPGLDLNKILDVSETGMSFLAISQVPVGRRVNLCLDLPEATSSVWTVGRVVWSQPSGHTGIRFAKLRGLPLKQLREWLFMNALAACAHCAVVQARAANSEPLDDDDASLPEVALVPPPEEIGALTQADYAAILTRLVAIRREVEAAGPDLESSLQLLAEHARVFTGASGTAIALASGEEMICRASVGSDAPGVGARFQLGSGFSGECVSSGVSLRCDDSETDARVDRESCRALGIRSMMAVPIRAGHAVVGLLEVFSHQPNAFSAKDRVFLQRLAEIVLASVHRSIQALAAGTLVSGNGSVTVSGATAELQSNPLGFEELSGEEVSSGGTSDESPPQTDTSDDSSSPRLGRILLIAAAALVLASVLVVPWVRNRFARSTSANQAQLSSQASTSKIPAGMHSPEADLDRLRKLAEQGDATAQFALGAHYALGEDVGQNYSTAAQWFSQAADQGHVVAQATLGAYYWAGTGVPKDLDKAYFWSVLAQAGGDEASKYRVSALAAQMSRSQIIAAQEEANDWLRQHQLASQTPQDSHP
jgi:putative methionine-R-sulfoxide reductase with GAF domain